MTKVHISVAIAKVLITGRLLRVQAGRVAVSGRYLLPRD
jgi:hypothetical protein